MFFPLSWGILALFHIAKYVLKPVGEFIQSIRIIIDLPDVTEYLWAFCNFFGAVGPAICGAGGSPSPGHQSKGARSTLAS